MGDTMREAFERAMIERHEWHPVMFARKTLPGCEDEYSNPHTEYAWQGAQIGRQLGMEQARATSNFVPDCQVVSVESIHATMGTRPEQARAELAKTSEAAIVTYRHHTEAPAGGTERARYSAADLKRLSEDRGPFARDNMSAALVWAARTLEAAGAAVKAERQRAEQALELAKTSEAVAKRAEPAEIVCSKCEMRVLSSCGGKCPVPNRWADAAPIASTAAENDSVLVDAVAWNGFVRDYDKYNSGDPKFPFSELRFSLAAVIDSATPQPAAERAAPLDTTRDGHERPLAWRDVLAERRRQINEEGWTSYHDDEHSCSEMALAAACYAMSAGGYAKGQTPPIWPWSPTWWKPAYGRRDLVKAGALILAEIERLDRAGIGQQAKEQNNG